MDYNIVLTSRARKELTKFEISLQKRIMNELNNLSQDSVNIDIKKLKDDDFYRLRIGDYRAVFKFELNTIIVVKIAHRKDIYKKK